MATLRHNKKDKGWYSFVGLSERNTCYGGNNSCIKLQRTDNYLYRVLTLCGGNASGGVISFPTHCCRETMSNYRKGDINLDRLHSIISFIKTDLDIV